MPSRMMKIVKIGRFRHASSRTPLDRWDCLRVAFFSSFFSFVDVYKAFCYKHSILVFSSDINKITNSKIKKSTKKS